MKQERNEQFGGTFLEFVLVFPLFMMFVFVIVDYGRISTVRTVVDEAIYRTLQRTKSVSNLDVDPRGLTLASVPYQRLKLAREKATAEGMNYLNDIPLVLTGPDAAIASLPGSRLFDMELVEDRLAPPGTSDVTTSKLMVLMPGECARVPALGITECNRETLKTTAAEPAPRAPPKMLIKDNPVKVVAYIQFDSFTPFLFRRPVRLQAFAYRQPIPQGPFPASEDPGLKVNHAPDPELPPLLPLGNPIMPEEPDVKCPVNWEKCIQKSMATAVAESDPKFPCYAETVVEVDGSCPCRKECYMDGLP